MQRTGDIGLFRIVAEGGVAAGVRRVEAVSGDSALAYMQGMESALGGVAGTFKAQPLEVPARVAAVLDQVTQAGKRTGRAQGQARLPRRATIWSVRPSTLRAQMGW